MYSTSELPEPEARRLRCVGLKSNESVCTGPVCRSVVEINDVALLDASHEPEPVSAMHRCVAGVDMQQQHTPKPKLWLCLSSSPLLMLEMLEMV
jgi:hypothetical protein